MKAKRFILILAIGMLAAFLLPCGCREDETPLAPAPERNTEKTPADSQETPGLSEESPEEVGQETAGEAADGEQPQAEEAVSPVDEAKPADEGEVSEGVKWYTDFEAAKKKAAAEGKDLVLNFSGSDWCYWCQQLEKQVFSNEEFARGTEKNFVFVLVDFPRTTEQPEEIKKQNEKLGEEIGFRGEFPTVYVANAKGVPYAKTGYIEGGARAYLNHLNEIRKYRE